MVIDFYQKWGTSDYKFVMLKDSYLVFMHSHIMCVIKFLMSLKDYKVSGNDLVYELNEKMIFSINLFLYLWIMINYLISVPFAKVDYKDII
jgi:hypothetical protein